MPTWEPAGCSPSVDAGVIDADTAAQVRKDARQIAIDARKRALGDPMPDPSTVEEGVYAD